MRSATLALISAALLVIAGAAAATTGVLPVGTVVDSGDDPEVQHEHGEPQTIVARGASPVAGPWRLTTARADADPHTGEAAGDCLQLQLSDPPPGTPIVATMLCERLDSSDLSAGSLPIVDASSDQSELLLFGTAPPDADAVGVRLEGRLPIDVRTEPKPRGYGGRTFVLAVPRGWRDGRLLATAKGLGPVGPALDPSAHLDRLREAERLAGLGE